MENKHYLYVLECADATFYAGYTTNIERRIKQHNDGKGAKYTRGRVPVKCIFFKEYSTKREAMQAEYAFKQLSRENKVRYMREGTCNDKKPKELFK
ncbi:MULTISPECIES: GIY-YIG nuclease family protein [unclassified Bacillus (in: firmicutes)]|uniref:GIY-YIG nuclease family protein n=1 Tax=Bacillaceae TaxID=186817 RepID=UPI000BEFD591|nr:MULTISPECIES: GIY-YIG nuclease family protein [unclassified Bacillus (in: firmicutes)]PEJ59817.1 endonuclease [Bacillus sp. AFS002410]PEL09999.1 endonuclease [Bacillus sp. AFS017336]QKE74565.1 GIY-YIG nuclease family protein [Arthrobacter citreus]